MWFGCQATEKQTERANAEGLKGIEYRVADLNKDRFEGPFDLIFAEGVLRHITNAESLLPHLNDILAPNGYMFGVEWAGPFPNCARSIPGPKEFRHRWNTRSVFTPFGSPKRKLPRPILRRRYLAQNCRS